MSDGQQVFLCATHEFVVVATPKKKGGKMSCRGTPGHRVTGCPTCDKAVDDAMVLIGAIESYPR